MSEKKLFTVYVSREIDATAFVWAENAAEAEQIAKDDVDLDDYDGYTTASANETKALDLKDERDWVLDEVAYGDPPPGVGEYVRDGRAYLMGELGQSEEWRGFKEKQTPLFDVDPIPLPCQECGKRFPSVPHEETCSAARKEE